MDERQALLQAREAIKRRDKKTARKLLYQAVKQYPKSETAWLWLSALVDDPQRELDCLNKVLQINPNNETARKHWLRLQSSASVPQPTQSETPASQPTQPEASASQPPKQGIKKNTKIILAGVVVAILLICFSCICFSSFSDSPGVKSKPKPTSTWPPTWTPAANPTVQSRSMSRQEAIRRVEDLLSDYNIIGVQEVIPETGDHVLAIYIRGSQSDAELLLNNATIFGSLYVIAANPPFDAISVVIYSPDGEVIIGSVVMHQDIENWLKGNISEEEFFNAWLIVTP